MFCDSRRRTHNYLATWATHAGLSLGPRHRGPRAGRDSPPAKKGNGEGRCLTQLTDAFDSEPRSRGSGPGLQRRTPAPRPPQSVHSRCPQRGRSALPAPRCSSWQIPQLDEGQETPPPKQPTCFIMEPPQLGAASLAPAAPESGTVYLQQHIPFPALLALPLPQIHRWFRPCRTLIPP